MRYGSWIGILGVVLWCAGMIAPPALQAATGGNGYTLDDLELDSAADLVDVCTLDASHNDFSAARAFCLGFFEGAIHYDEAISNTAEEVKIVCDPPETTRSQAVQAFTDYMQAHPQYGVEMPIDAIFRALIDKWPCTE